jgi:hypothetical protein
MRFESLKDRAKKTGLALIRHDKTGYVLFDRGERVGWYGNLSEVDRILSRYQNRAAVLVIRDLAIAEGAATVDESCASICAKDGSTLRIYPTGVVTKGEGFASKKTRSPGTLILWWKGGEA